MENLDAALLVRMTGAMKAEIELAAAENGIPAAALVRLAVARFLRAERVRRGRESAAGRTE
jgi:hypothetical protein